MKNFKQHLQTSVFLMFAIPLVTSGQTPVSGGIYSNTTWTLANSPYIVTDTVVVFPGVTLTIEPGVTIKFDDDQMLEIRQAMIIANGTVNDSITFTSNNSSPIKGVFEGLYLNTGHIFSFNFCSFKYADHGIRTSYVDTIFVKNTCFDDNNNGIVVAPFSGIYYNSASLDSCLFKNNLAGSLCGGDIYINNCKFFNNYQGIVVGTNYINNCELKYNHIGCGGSFIIKNCLVSNNDYGLYSDYVGDYMKVIYNIIEYNNIDGINSSNGNADIRYNNIKYNGNGIQTSGFYHSDINHNEIDSNNIGIRLYNNNATIYCNKICNNLVYNFYYNTSNNFNNLSNNYWCTTDSTIISSTIYDGYDNTNLGLVNYMPIDTSQCYLNSPCSSYFYIYLDSLTPHLYYAVNMASGISPITYTWSWGDGTFSTGPYPNHTYSNAGYYNICLNITDSNGCTHTYCDSSYLSKNTNSMVYVSVIPATGISKISADKSFYLYPNPANDKITIEIPRSNKENIISFYNIQGQLLLQQPMQQAKEEINITSLAKGVYIIKVSNADGIAVKKFIKE